MMGGNEPFIGNLRDIFIVTLFTSFTKIFHRLRILQFGSLSLSRLITTPSLPKTHRIFHLRRRQRRLNVDSWRQQCVMCVLGTNVSDRDIRFHGIKGLSDIWLYVLLFVSFQKVDSVHFEDAAQLCVLFAIASCVRTDVTLRFNL
jgi:hypothetical protein